MPSGTYIRLVRRISLVNVVGDDACRGNVSPGDRIAPAIARNSGIGVTGNGTRDENSLAVARNFIIHTRELYSLLLHASTSGNFYPRSDFKLLEYFDLYASQA